MREPGLLHEIDPSLPLPRLEANLYDNSESCLLLESNVVDDAPLTDLEEVFDLPRSPCHLLLNPFLAQPWMLVLVT